MKSLLSILFLLSFNSAFSQVLYPLDSLINDGKSVFKTEFDYDNFLKAAHSLEEALTIQPDNPEIHYFLGYVYSRLNSSDGEQMINMTLPMTQKSSEQFEKVNKLSPKYSDEYVVLDPYSKITSEWGSLAMSYLYKNKKDSAIWAFNEGKKRGGFGNFFLSANKSVLDLCSKNAILFSAGDNHSIPLWYLQTVENYRKDVTVIDVPLLYSNWYPAFLAKNYKVKYDLPQTYIDTIQYCYTVDTLIFIKDFSWEISPEYYGNYLLRANRIVLSILKQNKFKRDVFFTADFDENETVGLKDYFMPKILVNKVNINEEEAPDFKSYLEELNKILSLIKFSNSNSIDELKYIDLIRYTILVKIAEFIDEENIENAKILFDLIDKNINEIDFAYQNENIKEYVNQMRTKISE